MRNRGFTLIEVLVSLAIVMTLVGAATASFLQMRTMTRRIQARQELSDTSRLLFDRLRQECDAMIHASAWWMRSTATGGIELIFLRGKNHTRDFSIQATDPSSMTDMVWTRLNWEPGSKKITLGSSSPIREFRLTSNWTNPDGKNFANAYAAVLPQPVRQAGTDPESILDLNRLGNGDPNDIGDYGDLVRNALPVATGCTAFALQAVLANGTTVDATTGIAGEGIPIDGLDTIINGNDTQAWLKRPRLIRLRFTLMAPDARIDASTGTYDPSTVIEQTFSYSFRTVQSLPAAP